MKNILVLFLGLVLAGCAQEGDFTPHLKNKQNALAYVNPQNATTSLVNSLQEKKLYNQFLNHYYSPWTGQNTFLSPEQIKTCILENISSFTSDPGWGENLHPYKERWIKQLANNMDMNSFPNQAQNAITIRDANLRVLPTYDPSFSSITKPGWFYPFDNVQESYLPANLPVHILQVSKDKAWVLILTNGDMGWIEANNLAMVNKAFIKAWQKNQGYISFKHDNVAIIDTDKIFRFQSHMGALFPIARVENDFYVINIAIKDQLGRAVIKQARVATNQVYKIPLAITEENIATVANQFLGKPYGWGGLYGYRDCSATTKDIMSYFGIWLPRDSSQQATLVGKQINLTGMSNKQKEVVIQHQGVPFLTLVHLHGHIMLYLGRQNNTLYVLHDMWGLNTIRPFKSTGRAVVGKTVITPIDFGVKYINVTSSLLDKVIGLTLLSQQIKPNSVDIPTKNITTPQA